MQEARTTLMAYFEYNAAHPEARQYLYQDFPAKFVYLPRDRHWKPREREFVIGRMYHCNPMQGEKYYLRLLLTTVPGATSFEALRTVDGVEYPTFWAACLALGLLEDDRNGLSALQRQQYSQQCIGSAHFLLWL